MARQVTALEVALAVSNGRKVKKSGDGYLISCLVPGHEDHNPSCIVSDKKEGGLGIHCLSGCSSDSTWQALTDLGYVKPKSEKKFKDIPDEDCRKQFIKQWQWLNADKSIHLLTNRLELKRPDGSIKKKIPYAKLPDGITNPGNDYPVIPLYLPQVLEAAKAGRVIIDAEGEPKADIIVEWGMCGTTTGASSKKGQWEKSKVWEHFNGSSCVVILDDNDIPGLAWAAFKAKKMHEHGIPCKLLHLPGLGKRTADHGKDIKDWKLAGHTADELKQLIRATEFFKPDDIEEAPEVENVRQLFADSSDHLTEAANADHFLKLYGEDLLFITDKGKGGAWFIWDGKRFAEDRTHRMLGLVKSANKSLKQTLKQVQLNPMEKARWLKASMNKSNLKNTIDVGIDEKAITSKDLDLDPKILNCSNGLLNLETGILSDHRKDWLGVSMAPLDYTEDAECPMFFEFLKRIFNGSSELMIFDQMHMGSCLTGDTSDHKIVINKGEGANGKSVLMNLKRRLLGPDYAVTLPGELFKESDGDGNANSNYHQLVGKRLGVFNEIKKNVKLDEKKLKEVSDGSELPARALFGEVYNFIPQIHLVFNTNYRPNISNDKSVQRRLLFLPFDAVIEEKDQNHRLEEELWETERLGIFAWYVQGAMMWYANGGLKIPPAIEEFSSHTWDEGDLVKQFIASHCASTLAEELATKPQILHRAYRSMLTDQGVERKPTLSTFISELERLGYNKRRWRKDEKPKYLQIQAGFRYNSED